MQGIVLPKTCSVLNYARMQLQLHYVGDWSTPAEIMSPSPTPTHTHTHTHTHTYKLSLTQNVFTLYDLSSSHVQYIP